MKNNLKLNRTLRRLHKLLAKLSVVKKKDTNLIDSYQKCQDLIIALETYKRDWDRVPEIKPPKGDKS